MATLQPIVPKNSGGEFVLRTQRLATAEGFPNVSKSWYDETLPFDRVVDELQRARERVRTLSLDIASVAPAVVEGRFCLRAPSGRVMFPDSYAVKQLGSIFGTGADYPARLLAKGGPGDAEAVAFAFRHGQDGIPPRRSYQFRVDKENRLRAVLSDQYEPIRNLWYLGVIRQAIPDGRISHWRGDDDTIYGNVLVPSTLRREADSEYGAMVSISKSEIGKRSLEQRPSLFRAICMNGCIWGATPGAKLKQMHRGTIDQAQLETRIIENIREQIPLAESGIERLLAARWHTTDVAIKPVMAQVKKEFKLSKSEATAVLDAWHIEARTAPETRNSLFAVINSLTRAGQKLDNESWVRFDNLGGTLVNLNRSGWDGLVSRAARLPAKVVDESFALAV